MGYIPMFMGPKYPLMGGSINHQKSYKKRPKKGQKTPKNGLFYPSKMGVLRGLLTIPYFSGKTLQAKRIFLSKTQKPFP